MTYSRNIRPIYTKQPRVKPGGFSGCDCASCDVYYVGIISRNSFPGLSIELEAGYQIHYLTDLLGGTYR